MRVAILSGPLEPAATADFLMPLHLPTIRGNHERQLLACEQQRDWLCALPAHAGPHVNGAPFSLNILGIVFLTGQ